MIQLPTKRGLRYWGFILLCLSRSQELVKGSGRNCARSHQLAEAASTSFIIIMDIVHGHELVKGTGQALHLHISKQGYRRTNQ